MNKKIICLILCAVLCTCLFSGVSMAATTDELKEKIEQSKKQKEEANEKIKEIEGQENEILEKKRIIDDQIVGIQHSIDDLDAVINECDVIIEEKNIEIQSVQAILSEKDAQYKNRVRFMYERGDISYIEIIFGATSFSDFLSRLTMVQDIVSHDKNIVDEVTRARTALVEARKEVEAQRTTQEVSKGAAEEQRTDLEYNMAEQQAIADELAANREQYQEMSEVAEQEMADFSSQLNDIIAQQEAASRSGGSWGGQAAYVPSNFGGSLAWPLTVTGYISCEFGYRTDPAPGYHSGMDIAVAGGTPILAAADGVVITAAYGYNGGYGNYVMINHGGGTVTLYAHAVELNTTTGTSVKTGDVIAYVGNTGYSFGNHLHFEVIINGTKTDPRNYLFH